MNMQSERQRLHALTLVLRVLRSIPALALAIFSATASVSDSQQRLQLLVIVGLWVSYGAVALPLIVAHYMRFSYRITDREIIIRSGVFRRRKRNIPLERVQNVAIERRLLPRLFGLSSVKLMTAGSNEAEGVLEYTSHTEAQNIRDVVRRRSEQALPAAEGAAAEPAAASMAPKGKLLVAMSLRRVVLSGAFRFSLIYIAIIISGLAYVQQLSGISEQDVIDWIGSAKAEELASAAQRVGWIIALATILATCVLAWVTGVVVTITRFYNFKLHLLADKLIRSHGLLTLQEANIPLKRIQALVLRSNPLMRVFQWFRLELQTIGYDVSKRGGRMAVPLGRLSELTETGAHIRSFTLPDSFVRVSSIHFRRTFVRYMLALSLVLVPVGAFIWNWAFWGYVVVPLLGCLAWLQYRNHGYAIGEDMLYVRRGVIQQYLWIVPFERFQAFVINGTLFQRRLGVRTVSVDTAGGGYLRYPHIVDVPEATAHELVAALYDGLRRSVAP